MKHLLEEQLALRAQRERPTRRRVQDTKSRGGAVNGDGVHGGRAFHDMNSAVGTREDRVHLRLCGRVHAAQLDGKQNAEHVVDSIRHDHMKRLRVFHVAAVGQRPAHMQLAIVQKAAAKGGPAPVVSEEAGGRERGARTFA